MKSILIVVVAALGLLFLMKGVRHRRSNVDYARLLSEEDGVLLDVRTTAEYSRGHVDGAVNIPVQALADRLPELPSDKNRPIVVYCASGMRSARAQRLLQGEGYLRVFDAGAMKNL